MHLILKLGHSSSTTLFSVPPLQTPASWLCIYRVALIAKTYQVIMYNPGTAEFLCSLEGTDVTLDTSSEPPFSLPLPQTCVIEKKLSERAQWLTQQDVADGLGYPFAAAKFLSS